MRRKDREMDREFSLMVIDKSKYATISLITPENTPYCVPVSIARDKDILYLHCAVDGRKVDCFRHCNKVCVSFVGDVVPSEVEFTTEFESAIVEGNISEVVDEKEKIYALKLICEKFTPKNMINFEKAIEKSLDRTHVWKIEIENITGKRKKYDSKGVEMKFMRMEE